MTPGSGPRFTTSGHLTTLIAEVDRLAAAVAAAPADARERLRARQHAEVVRATLALDGADLDADLPDDRDGDDPTSTTAPATGIDPPAARTATGPTDDPADAAGYGGDRGGWLNALRTFDDPPDEHIRALEIAGVHAAEDADDLADPLLRTPLPTLALLHHRLTRGLVAADRAGAPRTTEQAVHDGSTGRMLYFTVEVAQVVPELTGLGTWLTTHGDDEHGLITSGVLHYELLRLHPYDAANGRLARAAARLVLRARGLDPDHLAAPEPALARDMLGYHEEVAQSLRRRDLTMWLERWGEAVADGLRTSARGLGLVDLAVPASVEAFLDKNPTFTVADHRAAFPSDDAPADAQLWQLLAADRIRHVPGSRGLRFTAVR